MCVAGHARARSSKVINIYIVQKYITYSVHTILRVCVHTKKNKKKISFVSNLYFNLKKKRVIIFVGVNM